VLNAALSNSSHTATVGCVPECNYAISLVQAIQVRGLYIERHVAVRNLTPHLKKCLNKEKQRFTPKVRNK